MNESKRIRRRYLGWIFCGVLVLAAAAALLLIADPFGGNSEPDTRALESDARARESDARELPPSPLEKKAERVERRLARRPADAKRLRATAVAWIEAGNDRLSRVDTRTQPIPGVVADDLRAGMRAWDRYLRQTGGDAGGDLAELAGGAYFHLLEIGSRDVSQIEANAAGAARALTIAGRHKPILFTLSLTAIYDYFNGEFAAGERPAKGAAEDIVKSRKHIVVEQLDEYRERAEYFRGQLRRAKRELRETGENLLREPLRAYSSSVEINKDDPAIPNY